MRRLTFLSLLVLLGFALRVHLLGNQELRGDEGFTWNYIQKTPLEILTTIVREGDPQPPIHYWLQWGWLQFTGDSEFAMRAWSAFLSLLLIPLMFLVGTRLWRTEIGWLAAALTALHPQQIWLAQDVRNMYQLALTFLLIATLFLPQLATQPFNQTRKLWALYIACGVLAMYSHYYALFFLAAHGAYFIFQSNQRALLTWTGAGLIIGALVLPWALVILPVYAQGQLADPGHLSLATYAWASFGDLLAGPAQTDDLKTWLIVAGFILGLLGCWAIWIGGPARSRFSLLAYLLAGLLIPLFGIYAVTATRSTFNTFYFSFATPAAYLLLSAAFYYLYQAFKPLGLTVAAASLILFGLGLFNHYYNASYTKTRGFRDIAAYLAAHAQPDDIYLANAPDPAQVYYIHNLIVNYHMAPAQLNQTPQQIATDLSTFASRRIWFVPANTALDPQQRVEQRLNQVAIKAEDAVHYRTTLQLFIPPTRAQPLNAQFADGIALVGYYYTPNRLTLVWRANTQPTADYTIFVHALAADTFNLTGKDGQPPIPTSQWQPGQLIVDVHEFDVPADQPVVLVAGLYLPQTGQRLALQTKSWGEENATEVLRLTP